MTEVTFKGSGEHGNQPPFYFFLGKTHVIEIKKGGTYLGLYFLTKARKKRGVIFHESVWNLIETASHGVDAVLGFAKAHAAGKGVREDERQYGRDFLSYKDEQIPSALQSYFSAFLTPEGSKFEREILPFFSTTGELEKPGSEVEQPQQLPITKPCDQSEEGEVSNPREEPEQEATTTTDSCYEAPSYSDSTFGKTQEQSPQLHARQICDSGLEPEQFSNSQLQGIEKGPLYADANLK
jgi:hypothetical protein